MRHSLLFLLALQACGHSKDKASAPPPPASFGLSASETHGFELKCAPYNESKRSELSRLLVEGQNFETVWISFDGPQCDADKTRTTHLYKFRDVEDEVSPEMEGWKTYVYSVAAITCQVHSVRLAKVYSRDKVYGYDDWNVNEPKDVTGRQFDETSRAKPKVGDIRVSTVRLQESTLLLARYRDGHATDQDPYAYVRVK